MMPNPDDVKVYGNREPVERPSESNSEANAAGQVVQEPSHKLVGASEPAPAAPSEKLQSVEELAQDIRLGLAKGSMTRLRAMQKYYEKARQLERELAAAKERIEHMNSQLHDLCQQLAELEAAGK